MSFSFCLNKNEMLTLCGLSLLYQGLDLKQEGKLMQDGQRLVVVVTKFLEKANAPGAADFKRLAASLLHVASQPKNTHSLNGEIPVLGALSSKSTPSPTAPRKQQPSIYRHPSASMSESDLLSQQEKIRRATLPNLALLSQDGHHYGRASTESTRSASPLSKRDHRNSASQLPTTTRPRTARNEKPPNLDYLSLSNTPVPSQPQSPVQSRPQQAQNSQNPAFPTSTYSSSKISTATPTEWEVLLGSFDDRHLYDAIYGGGPTQALPLPDASSNIGNWSPESWDYTSLGMNDFTGNGLPARSVLSFSEESLSSGDDLSASDLGLPGTRHDYKQALLSGNGPAGDNFGYLFDGLDAGFNI